MYIYSSRDIQFVNALKQFGDKMPKLALVRYGRTVHVFHVAHCKSTTVHVPIVRYRDEIPK